MSSLFYQKIGEIATVHGELFSSLKSREGDRGRVIANNGELFHACMYHELPPMSSPCSMFFEGFCRPNPLSHKYLGAAPGPFLKNPVNKCNREQTIEVEQPNIPQTTKDT